jgi:2-succinyl-6-hydroxy-2,4-cyclohexadiene-1-carboxylate synthase
MQELSIPVGQVNIHFQDYQQAGEAVVFLHFSGANLMMWQRALPFLQDGHRLILVDMRGHGKSDKPDTGYHMDELAQDIVAVMDHLKLEQAHVVGCSMGAEVGLSLAANFPERVLSLICEGALYSEYGPYSMWEGTLEEFNVHVAQILEKMQNTPDEVFPSADALVLAYRERISKYVKWNEFFETMKRYDIYQIAGGQYANGWGKLAKVDYMKHYFNSRYEDYYRRVKCPLLIMPDEEDSQIAGFQKTTNGFKELASRAKIVTAPGWVHPYGWLLDPEPMCKTILEFLGQV